MDLRDMVEQAAAEARRSVENHHRRCRDKTVFRLEERARAVAAQMTERYGEPMYAYHCSACNNWHTTRQPQIEL